MPTHDYNNPQHFQVSKLHPVCTEIDIECCACKKLQPLGSNCVKCGKALDGIFVPKDLVCYYTKEEE